MKSDLWPKMAGNHSLVVDKKERKKERKGVELACSNWKKSLLLYKNMCEYWYFYILSINFS